MPKYSNRDVLKLAQDKGFIFHGAKAFATDANIATLANDAAFGYNAANNGVPYALTTFVDPKVVEVMTAPTRSREIFGEVKKGDWTDSAAVFPLVEMAGASTPYADFSNGGSSDINATFPSREQYLFQTTVRVGEREVALTARAMIDLASQKQRAAATTLDKDANKINLLGVAGKEIYGLLNEPNLPAAIVAKVGVSGTSLWTDKDTKEIYRDIIDLHAEQVANSQGLIDANTELVLAVSPNASVRLATASDYNVSVLDMLKKYFSNLKVVVLPELSTYESGDMVYLIAQRVNGVEVGEFGFSEKIRTFPVIQSASSWEQKFMSTSYGCVLYYPFAVQGMTGI